MSRPAWACAILVAIVVSGCSKSDPSAPTFAALEAAEQYELLSLDPTELSTAPPDHFHGWRILGRTSIADPATRKKLNDALRSGVIASDGAVARCFDPRHGLRLTQGGRTTDLVICFHCEQAHVFIDGKRSERVLTTTASPQSTFDGELQAAGIPLAEEPK